MPHSYGARARTRDLFSKKKRGMIAPSKLLQVYKIGDYVDIKVDPSQQSGMPYKYYQGRTGIIWNVAPRSVGVIIRKQIKERYVDKKIHVRIEHVRKSRCRETFLARVKTNLAAVNKAKAEGKKFKKNRLKRQPKAPLEGYIVDVKAAGEPQDLEIPVAVPRIKGAKPWERLD